MEPLREPQDPAEALVLVRRSLEATYRIAEAALGATEIQELYGRVHAILRDLMPAENLYFALWDRASGMVSFPYWVDARDPAPEPRGLRRGLTELVLRTSRPLLVDGDTLARLEASGEVEPIGTDSLGWLGAPLMGDHGVFGALVIQIYDGTRCYTEAERDLLVFISRQVAMAIERRRAEASHRMMASAVDRARDAIYGIDASARVVFVNEAACRDLGYDRETLLDLSLADVDCKFPASQWPQFMATLRAQRTLFLETEHRRRDGSTFPVEVSVCHLTHEGRDLAFGYARDITERKDAERALRLSQEKFSRAFQASPDAINLTRMDGTILDVNEAFTAMSGWTREETLGRTTLDMGLWANLAERDRAMEALRREGHFTGLEASFRIKDGTTRSGLISGTVMMVDGQPCMLSITRDITEWRMAEEALRQAQKLESLGVLAGGIAHDFNNLLTVIMGNLNLAQMHLPGTSPALSYLANMEATVLRATELTKQMLAYSGRGHFQVRPLDLNAAVRDLTHLLEVSISKKVRLRTDLEPELPPVLADAAQIQQVVMNLVTNASDAIGDREGVIHITTNARFLDARTLKDRYRMDAPVPGRFVILEVEDTGSGMAPEILTRIFDPFFSTKATGRGLGLSAMLGILRGHRGGLQITSQVDQGSTFSLCFPATDAAPSPGGVPGTEAAPGPAQGRVLLVDDDPRILDTTRAALVSMGYQVLTAEDGLAGLERFREARGRLDLVLMDLTMPRMDGREAFQAMKALDPGIPVVLSSGYTEQDALQTLPGTGPAAFLQKPYQLRDLRAILRKVLGG